MIEEETRPMIKGHIVDLFLYKFSHSPRSTATVHAYQGSEPNERLACPLFWSGPLKALAKIQSVVSATAAHRRKVHGLVPRRRMQVKVREATNVGISLLWVPLFVVQSCFRPFTAKPGTTRPSTNENQTNVIHSSMEGGFSLRGALTILRGALTTFLLFFFGAIAYLTPF